jgi:hypothetical protein
MRFLKIVLLWGAMVCSLIGCKKQTSPNHPPTPVPKQNVKTTPDKNIPKEKTPPHEKTTPQVVSVQLKDWEDLMERFYRHECEIKEKLRPLFSRKKELETLEKYLPQLYTPSLYAWFMQYMKSQVADPPFPIGPVAIEKIEHESDEKAAFFLRVLCEKKGAKSRFYQRYKLSLVREEMRWVIDKEEAVQIERYAKILTLSDRNVFGHLYFQTSANLSSPQLRSQTPQELFASLLEVARYLRNEEYKMVAEILPPLMATIKPFLSQRYYKELAKRLTPQKLGVGMKIQKFEACARPPSGLGSLGKEDICWELFVQTFRISDGDPLRIYHYYLILRKDQNQWKTHLEAEARNPRMPAAGPLLDNLMYWQVQ